MRNIFFMYSIHSQIYCCKIEFNDCTNIIQCIIFHNVKDNFILILQLIFIISRIFVGIKKLLALIDMVKQVEDDYKVVTFLTKLEEEGEDY